MLNSTSHTPDDTSPVGSAAAPDSSLHMPESLPTPSGNLGVRNQLQPDAELDTNDPGDSLRAASTPNDHPRSNLWSSTPLHLPHDIASHSSLDLLSGTAQSLHDSPHHSPGARSDHNSLPSERCSPDTHSALPNRSRKAKRKSEVEIVRMAKVPRTRHMQGSAPIPATPGWLSPHVNLFYGPDIICDEKWTELLRKWIAHEVEYAAEHYTEVHHQTSLQIIAYHFSLQRYKNLKVERPDGLAEWIKRARAPSYKPSIQDTTQYGNKWHEWWYAIQPASRQGQKTRALLRKGRHDLSKVVLCGPNGFLNVVMSLFWWRKAMAQDSDVRGWNDAVADVTWVLKHHTS